MAQSNFRFVSDAVGGDQFVVIGFTGHESISGLYRYDVELKAPVISEINLDDILEGHATFISDQDGTEYPVHGVLSSFEEIKYDQNYTYYKAILVPKIWKLSNYKTNEIYYKAEEGQSIDEVIRQVLEKAGMVSTDFDLNGLSGNLLKREYLCQYNESDFDFISRLMENEGVFYYFEQSHTQETIVFINDMNYLTIPRPKLLFDVAAMTKNRDDCVHSLSCRKQRLPENVIVRDYNPDEPSLDVSDVRVIDSMGQGTEYIYGKNVLTDEEAKYLSQIRAEEHICRKTQYFGESSVTRLQTGYIFTLDGHPNGKYNNVEYLTVEVTHEGQHLDLSVSAPGKANVKPQYQNSFVAIPADTQFRPLRRTPKPRITGTLHARIDGEQDSEHAQLDDQGRYKVSLPFDFYNENHPEGLASARVRMLQPYAGKHRGMQFPLPKGTDVLLSFIDGDPDRPVIAGAISTPTTPSPVNAQNQSESVIQTGGNNRVRFEDQAGSERIIMETPSLNSWIRIGAPNDPPPTPNPVDLDGDGSNEIEYASHGIRIKTDGSIWHEALNLYGDYIAGAPKDANTDTSDYDYTANTTKQTMLDKFGVGYTPTGVKPMHRTLASGETYNFTNVLNEAHIKVSSLDTVTTQEGNIYDFGGYWNYNLGNSFAEEHINQTAALNSQNYFYWPSDSSSATASTAITAAGSGAIAGAATASTFALYIGGTLTASAAPHLWNPGGATYSGMAIAGVFIFSTAAVAAVGAGVGAALGAGLGAINANGENFQGNMGDVIEGPGDASITTWARRVGSSFVGTSTTTQNSTPEGDYDSTTGEFSQAMHTRSTWVTKQFGDSYNYTRGNDISIRVGNTEEHTRGNSHAFTYGGTHEDTKFNASGKKVAWEKFGGGVSQEAHWHPLTGLLTSYEYKKDGWFTYEGSFVTVPTLKLSTSMSSVRGTADVSTGALDVNISAAAGIKIDVNLCAGLWVNMHAKGGGEADVNFVTQEYGFKTFGVDAQKKAAMKAEIQDVILEQCLSDIGQKNLKISGGSVTMDGDALSVKSGMTFS